MYLFELTSFERSNILRDYFLSLVHNANHANYYMIWLKRKVNNKTLAFQINTTDYEFQERNSILICLWAICDEHANLFTYQNAINRRWKRQYTNSGKRDYPEELQHVFAWALKIVRSASAFYFISHELSNSFRVASIQATRAYD